MADSVLRDEALRDVPSGLDDDATAALREILTDPALPVASIFSAHPGTTAEAGKRIAALREAHDYLTSRKLAAVAAQSADAAATLVTELGQVDATLAATLRWHAVLAPTIASLPASRARNAVLGDLSRGELLTWAPSVRSWVWTQKADPIGKVDAAFEVDEFPGLYDAVLVWEPSAGVVVVPTHRERVSWEPAEPRAPGGSWVVRLAHATVHADEVIPLDIPIGTDLRDLAIWLEEDLT
jgi:hypothetical protein